MLAKLGEPSINPKDPWADDVLDRRQFGQTLVSMISSVAQPFVISVKGEWGSGKSVFLRRLRHDLEGASTRIPVVHVDAWKSDHYEDPIYALISAVDARLDAHRADSASKLDNATRISRELFESAAKVVAPLMKVAGAAIDMTTGGAASHLIGGLGDLGEALLAANDEKTDAQARFTKALTEARDELLGRETEPVPRPLAEKKIVIVIDELDRCRPDYAIKLLERVKHFFEIPGIVFVIAVDGKNLHHAVNTLYGPAVESEVYLRKFFDIEMYLPRPSMKSFNALLRQSFAVGVGTEFEGGNWKHICQNFFSANVNVAPSGNVAMVEASAYFEVFAEAYDLRLRDQAQAFARLNACVLAAGNDRSFLPFAAAFLVCLRYHRHDLYEDWRTSTLGSGAFQRIREASLHQRVLDLRPEVGEVVKIYLDACHAHTVKQLGDLMNKRSGQDAIAYHIIFSRLTNDYQKLMVILKRSYETVFAVSRMLETT